ncbi:MAG: EAL domain-containing protein [Nitrospinae bacterium]|nr:EAL domain-containing protein [Nitrospinota bacterium]
MRADRTEEKRHGLFPLGRPHEPGAISVFQSGSLVSALFEAAPIPLIIFDSEQGVLSANEAFAALTGVERDDILGQSLADFLESPGPEVLGQSLQTGGGALSASLKNPEGAISGWLKIIPTGAARQDGEAGYFIGRFVEDRVLAGREEGSGEAEFARISELLTYSRRLVENCPVGAWVIDFDTLDADDQGEDQVGRRHRQLGFKAITRQVNSKTLALLGRAKEDMVGRSIFHPELVDDEQAELMSRELKRRRGGESSTYIIELNRKGGGRVPLLIEAAPTRLDPSTGAIIQSLAMMVDLTDRLRIEQELKETVVAQTILNDLLAIHFRSDPLEAKLEEALNTVLCIPWLHNVSRGCIFLVDPTRERLILHATSGVPSSVSHRCRSVTAGECLCGKVMASGEFLYSAGTEAEPTVLHADGQRHGYYIAPIKEGNDVKAVLTVFLEPGRIYKESEAVFLKAAASAIGGILSQSRHMEALKEARASLEQRIAERTHELRNANEALQAQMRQTGEARTRALESERRMRSILENMQDIFYRADLEGRFLWLTGAVSESLGYEPEELMGVRMRDLCVTTADKESLIDLLERRGRVHDYQFRLRHKNGAPVWFSINAQYYRDGDGGVLGVEGTFRDISDRKQDEERLQLASLVFENAVEGVAVTDPEGRILSVNPAFSKITGYEASEAIGQKTSILRSDRQSDPFYRSMWGALLTVGHWRGEIWNRKKSGEAYPEWLTITAIRNDEGKTIQYVSVFHDITELKRTEEQVKYLAYHDSLTKLPNRTLLLDRLTVALAHARRKQSRVAVMFLDLDHFKRINDSLGHAVGDRFLQDVAGRIKACLRQDDTVGRVGGDEFIILLEDVQTVDAAVAIARKVIKAMRDPFEYEGHLLYAGVSIGVTFFPDDADTPEILVRNADMAMYRAKEKGRNNYQLFTAEMDAIAMKRLSLEGSLRRAVEAHEFEIWYQPKVCFKSGILVGSEALVRWRRADGGLVSPADFIPLAEETSLIVPIGEQVLRQACLQTQQLRTQGYKDITVAVNLSPRQFEHRGLVRSVRRVLEETGLPPEALCLEITESAVMSDVTAALSTLAQFREMGIKIAMDDFGTGYSSLSFLRQMPIHLLKIDKSFISDMEISPNAAAIANTIVALGHNLSLTLVAEGIETVPQYRMLKDMGCDEMQGYLIGKPVPDKEFAAFLASYRPIVY